MSAASVRESDSRSNHIARMYDDAHRLVEGRGIFDADLVGHGSYEQTVARGQAR